MCKGNIVLYRCILYEIDYNWKILDLSHRQNMGRVPLGFPVSVKQ
jgi:hypothetical protein